MTAKRIGAKAKKNAASKSIAPKRDTASSRKARATNKKGEDVKRKSLVNKVHPKKKKQQESSEEEESSSEEESTSSNEEEEILKQEKESSSDSDSSSEDEKQKGERDSDSDSSDDDDSSSSDEDEDEEKGAFFTDENAAWLKPTNKSQLLSSDEEEEEKEQDEEEDEDLLEVERQSRLVDAEMEAEELEARQEMERTIARNTEIFHLPTPEELAQDENRVVPPSEIRARIESILEVLADFKTRREPGRSRSEYVDQLVVDMAELFGYLPELMEHFESMLGPSETYEFVVASDKTRPLVVRTNTLKTRRKDLAAALMKRGVTLDPLAPWSKVGLLISASTVPIGATPEYLSGHYMLQSAASMCPVLALQPQPQERVLDMSAAPGGKTSYIAQLMQNTGSILANDLKPSRQKATVANMHRLGVRNVITCCHDGRKLGKLFPNRFDKILLDAPCSGLGVISRDPSVKVQRTMEDVKRTAHLQKELLLAAIDALNYKKGGGTMVYSTCSVSVLENEEVVNYALSKRDIKIVDAGLEFGKPGFTRYQNKRFHPSVALTRRFYPHVHNMDGFFVAKIQKLSDRRPQDTLEQEEEPVEEELPVVEKGKKRQAGKSQEKKQPQKKKTKKETISVPPAMKQTKKKKKQNAKTLKPRRRKAHGM